MMCLTQQWPVVDGSREGCEREAADILWKQGNRDGIAGDTLQTSMRMAN